MGEIIAGGEKDMVRQRLGTLAGMCGAIVVIMGLSTARAVGQGHGGGPGHGVAGPGGYGRGYGGYGRGYGHYGYGRGFGYYGYGYPGFWGPGLGFGLGLGLACAYPYGYAYGYPVCVDVVPVGPPPVYAAPPAGVPFAGQAPVPPTNTAASGPVRLTESDVLLSIHVPPDAIVKINGTPSAQSGQHREFMSSGLAPGRSYTFTVTAHWTAQDGHVVDTERRIQVQGGERRNVDFGIPAMPAE
jgi:uncharacterized protein (TIGR03000 family)